MIRLLYISICFIHLTVIGQEQITVEEMQESLSNMKEYYESENYYIEFQMTSFRGHSSHIAEDKSSGFILKNRDQISNYQMGVYTIQNEDLKVIVDSNERYVGLNYPDSKTVLAIDEEQIIRMKSKIKTIHLTTTANGRSTYEVEFMEHFQYHKLKLVVESNGFMKELILFFAESISYEDDKGALKKDKAKVKISYTEGKFSLSRQKYTIPSIVKVEKDIHTLTPLFKGFELIEFRYKK